MEDDAAKDLLGHLADADAALRDARSALRLARQMVRGHDVPVGIPLSDGEKAKATEARRMHDLMLEVLDVIASMMGPERRWATTEQVLVAAHSANIADSDARAALEYLSSSGTIYNAGGKDTWAPMNRVRR